LSGSNLSFNLSHSSGLAVIGVGRALEVGLDLELLRDLPDVLEVAKVAFSEQELHALAHCPTPGRSLAFLQHWVKKEAYLKGLGVGVASCPPSAISIPFETAGTSGWHALPRGWVMRALDVGSRYVAAVAAHPRPASLTVRVLQGDHDQGGDGVALAVPASDC
jgi:4'-phosphopantetheinyl transferase